VKVFVAVADVDALVKRQPAIDAPLDLFEYADVRAAALRILQGRVEHRVRVSDTDFAGSRCEAG